MPNLTPSALQPILAHLLQWGELSSAEARRFKAEAGLALLTSARLAHAASDAWLIGPALERLLPGASLEEIWQSACWYLPAYQAYLTCLAAGDIARHGLEGAGDLVEMWVMALSKKAKAFNAFLDEIERNDLVYPLVESTPGSLVQAVGCRLKDMDQACDLNFSAWNRDLLGVSAPDEAVFQAALRREALADAPDPVEIPTPGILPPVQDLNTELAQPCGRWVFCHVIRQPNPLQHPALAEDPAWRTRRYLFSSVPLMVDGDTGTALTLEHAQRAFCQHPLSWVIIQFALYAQIQANSGAGEALRLALERNPEGMVCDLRLELPGGEARHLSEALPALIGGLDMRLLLPFGMLSLEALGSWLEALLHAGILEARGENLTLGWDFGRLAYESQYYQALVKTPKPHRARLVEILKGGVK
jgi:hypothetical protein